MMFIPCLLAFVILHVKKLKEHKQAQSVLEGDFIVMRQDVHWYLVQCKARESFRAETHLKAQGFECFHPTHQIKKKNRGSIQIVLEPLFPFYLFVSLGKMAGWSSVRSTRGVKNIVTFNHMPAIVPQSIIDGLRYQCQKINSEIPAPLFKRGQRVIIQDGCFKNLEAIVAASCGEERVILLLNLLNREQTIEFPVDILTAL